MNDLQITYFLALCQYKNFTETARRLYVSQPAISKQILALESEMGCPLFIREYKSVELTPEGIILQDTLEKTEKMIQLAKEKMYQISHQKTSSLKIAILQGFEVEGDFGIFIREFMQKHTDINIIIECLSHREINTLIRSNELDLVLTLQNEIENDPLLCFEPYCQSQPAFTISSSHPFYGKTELTPENFVDQKIFISISGAINKQPYTQALTANYGIAPSQYKEVENIFDAISLMNSGAGIAILPKQNFYSKNGFQQFPISNLTEEIVLAWHYNNVNPARDILLNELY